MSFTKDLETSGDSGFSLSSIVTEAPGNKLKTGSSHNFNLTYAWFATVFITFTADSVSSDSF